MRLKLDQKRMPALANVLDVFYFLPILVIALAAIPLMLPTHGGQG